MGFSAMGVLFISFPEDESTTTIITKNKLKSNTFFINPSSKNYLFPKAQFIISLCLLLIFITFLLFTINEPPSSSSSSVVLPRKPKLPPLFHQQQHALQGMGSLYRKGTRSFTQLIIAHVTESVTLQELKLFVKLIHFSEITSKSDVLFMFHAKLSPFEKAIVEETTSFFMHGYYYNNFSDFQTNHSEPIWGRRKMNYDDDDSTTNTESTRLSYGSVVGFYADELDPENTLSGFMDHDVVPMKLRRWACYPMLLGRIRRNFKHVMLVDVKEIFLLGDDSLSRLKNLSQDSILVTTQSNHHHRRIKSIDKTQFTHMKQANPEVIMGGLRGIRRLSSAMLIEIVRESMQHKKKTMKKKKNSVTESTLFNQLVENVFLLKNVDIILGESIHSLSSLTELDKKSGSALMSKLLPMVRRGNSNLDINSVFKNYLCSFPLESRVYSDC